MKCTGCGNRLVKGTEKVSRTIGGHSFTAEIPALKCSRCGEVQFTLHDLEQFELSVARSLALAGASSGEVFKFQRKALGLKATELGELLDATPETISRWETGQREIPRAALAVVGTLVEDALGDRTDTASKLRALAKPKKLAKQIRLDFATGDVQKRA